MRSIDNIAEELFDKIRSRVSSIKLGDENGVQTIDPGQARFFEFNFKHRDLPIGAVTVSLNNEGLLQIYFPNSMVEDADSSTADAWYGFLKELSKFSSRNMLNYETHNLTKERLDKKDYQFLTQRNQDEVMENKLHGTSQKSFLQSGTAKLIIQHSKAVDETKMGARSRNISAIYIENNEGERFKFANNYLPGARAMARHVSNEGHTRDDRGLHIVDIMREMTDLKTFVRSIKRDEYVNEDAQEVIDAATDRYYGLKDTLKSISSAKGYLDYFENWVPGAVEVDENDIEDLKQKLTREVYDDRLTDSLASVRRAMDYKANMEAKAKDDEEELDAPIKPYFDRSIDPAEKKNLDDKADANTASSEQALDQLANSDDDIVIFDNPNKQEIKNYLQMMKNSDMPVDKKNQNIIVNIIEYLANNIVDDNIARAIANLDLTSPQGRKTGMQLAMKYLKGKIDLQAPKAKKDIKGKEKTESVTFEAFEKNMELISEGTWALPDNEADAMKIVDLMKKPLSLGKGGDDAINALGGLLGDDELFDDLGDAGDKDPEGDARGIIIGWMEEHTDWENPTYGEMIKKALAKIKADGTMDNMTIPRTFGNKREDVEVTENAERIIKVSNIDYAGPALDKLPTETTLKLNIPNDADEDDVYDMVADELEDRYGVKVSGFDMNFAESVEETVEELPETVDEVAESIAKMKAMAGVGSNKRSNYGINPGEEGYQITPRSIVAREMRKLQDIESRN